MTQAKTPVNGSTDSIQQRATEILDLTRNIGEDLRINHGLLKKLHLDSSLDHDLALDSLTRMEFFARVEKHFAVALPEEILGNIETPRELLREIIRAESSNNAHIQDSLNQLVLDQTRDNPDQAETLVDVIYWHYQKHPKRPHIRLLQENAEELVITYGELVEGAERVAAGLQQQGLKPREAVSIMLPTSRDYFFCFFGILIAGGTPVPIYPPARPNQLEDHLLRHSKIMANCQATILVTIPEAKPVARLLKAQAEQLHSIVTPEELWRGDRRNFLRPPVSPDDIAFLQYTSGSTGVPKGVTLTHANLLANIRAMGSKVGINSTDIFVSWLPLYHDMGLIGAWLGNLYYASLLVIMSPLAFLARPERWLHAIHHNKATLTAAPNFAYELCIKRIPPEKLKGLKLNSLRAVFNGAEPISPGTLERFAEHFAPYGYDANAMMPVYGLAECSLGLAFPPMGRGPKIDSIDRNTFMDTGRAKQAKTTEDALRFVCCGEPLPGHEIRIVDNQGRELPENHQGQLEFRGPSTTGGYYRNPEATRALFHNEWLNSGDMAYISGGEVFITGRSKDIIIHAGKNIYPHELEEAVSNVAGVRRGCVAVFGHNDDSSGTEKLIVLAETREEDEDKKQEIALDISSVVAKLAGTAPDDVVLAPPHAVLKTSSGKIRRAGCKELYQKGLIGKGSRPVWHQLLRMALASGVPQLRRQWQSLLTTLYAVYTWLLFVPIFLLGWLIVVLLPGTRLRWQVIHNMGKRLTRMLGIRFQVKGLENLPRNRPCILLCNHASYTDGFFLASHLPIEFSFVAKVELSRQPLIGRFLRAINTYFVTRTDKDQSTQDAQRISRAAASGRSILFFPEGTMTRMPGLLPFQSGAFSTASDNQMPVVPMALRGSRSYLRNGSWMPRRTAITLHIAAPIEPAAFDAENRWQHTIQLREQARTVMLGMVGEPDLDHEKSALRKAVELSSH